MDLTWISFVTIVFSPFINGDLHPYSARQIFPYTPLKDPTAFTRDRPDPTTNVLTIINSFEYLDMWILEVQ